MAESLPSLHSGSAAGVAIEYNAHLPLIGVCIRAFQNIYVSKEAVYGRAKHQPSVMGDGKLTISQAIAERCGTRQCLSWPQAQQLGYLQDSVPI